MTDKNLCAQLSLAPADTYWILFLASSGEPDERHVLDLAFGLTCLEYAGVARERIAIYIDGDQRSDIESSLSLGALHDYSLERTAEFFTACANGRFRSIIMFVSGHGSPAGIEAAEVISPHRLFESIRSAPNLESSVVYLSQCYAGVFNNGCSQSEQTPTPTPTPRTIVVGATRLYESLSAATEERLAGGAVRWHANLFLLNVFRWLRRPVDLDGDGKATVLDSFYYAGIHSNAQLKAVKKSLCLQAFDLHNQWIAARRQFDVEPCSDNRLAFEAINNSYMDILDLRYVQQECWISNPAHAQKIVI